MAEDEDKSQTRKIKARLKLAKTATMNQFDLAKLGLMKMTSKGNLYEPSTKGHITFEGFLFKKSPGGIPLMRHWHKRWFVLESPGKLLYYVDKEKTELKGIIPLDMIEKMLFRATRLTLLMEGASETAPPRKFSLKAESDDAVKTWATAINKAFEELDRMEDEAEGQGSMDNIGDGDSKYWKVETRKKLNLSVALDDKPKKKKGAALKIDPRAKEIEAQIAERDAAEQKKNSVSAANVPEGASSGYMPLNDDYVAVAPPSAVSSSSPDLGDNRQTEQGQVERQRQQEEQERQRALEVYRAEQERVESQRAREVQQEEQERVERQRAREMQEQADLAAAIAASQMDQRESPPQILEG
jgi:hypothetical protein